MERESNIESVNNSMLMFSLPSPTYAPTLGSYTEISSSKVNFSAAC